MNCLLVEIIVSVLVGNLYCKVNVFKERKYYLAENFFPEFQREITSVFVENFKEYSGGFFLNLSTLLHYKVSQVVHYWEPETLQYTMLDPSLIRLVELSQVDGLLFVFLLSGTVRSLNKTIVLLREPCHIVTILLEKHSTLKFDEVLHEIFPC